MWVCSRLSYRGLAPWARGVDRCLHAEGLGRSARFDSRSWTTPCCRETQPSSVLVLVIACESGRSCDGRLLAVLTLVAGLALRMAALGRYLSTIDAHIEHAIRAHLEPQW